MFKNNVIKGITVITTIAGLLSFALVLPSATVLGAPQNQGGSDESVVHSPINSEAQAEAASGYWTPERMASAAPYPMPMVSSDSQTSIQPAPAQGLGATGLVDGGAPAQ